jgi:hypothetical protein
MFKKIIVFTAVAVLLLIVFGGMSNLLHFGTTGLSNVMDVMQKGAH